MTGSNGSRAYAGGVAVALLAAFLNLWAMVVRDDGSGIGFFLVMPALVGSFAAWFQAAGMARAMLGVAAVQIVLIIATVTAPVTATLPDGIYRAWLFGGAFTALWLISAVFFRAAAKDGRPIISWP